MRDTQWQRHRQREKQDPCWEPDAGLNPRTLGSQPKPKADTQPAEPPRCPCTLILFFIFLKDFIYLFMKDTEREAGFLWGT